MKCWLKALKLGQCAHNIATMTFHECRVIILSPAFWECKCKLQCISVDGWVQLDTSHGLSMYVGSAIPDSCGHGLNFKKSSFMT